MQALELKLKQASAVLQTDPKELQNLVQSRVLRPKRRDGVFFFDTNVLLIALVGLYMKRAFGIKVNLLAAYAAVLASRMDDFCKAKPDFVIFTSHIPRQSVEVELRIPFRQMAEELEERLQQLPRFRDLPRGRKRPGWKKEFLNLLQEGGKDLGGISEAEIARTVRNYRKEKRMTPEITIAAEG